MEAESTTSKPEDEIIWPKGRQIKKLLPKFGSNRNPGTVSGRRPNGKP